MSSPIVVPGSAEVASAGARRLFVGGCDVVLADVDAPSDPRRVMAFTGAWFDRTAMPDGVPPAVVESLRDRRRPAPKPMQWAARQPLRRCALPGLAGRRSTRNRAADLAEFGLDGPSAAG